MDERPNARAETNDFEFAALREARNYRQALRREFEGELRGEIVEVGAGIGQMTEELAKLPAVRRVVAIEPDARFCAQYRQRLPGRELIEGTAADLPAGSSWDAVLSINVLEHIGEDSAELSRYAGLLRQRRGRLCLFVPAGPEIYAPIDKDFGHFRRYNRPELRGKLVGAGFEVERLQYFNSLGYFAWWLNFCVLKKRAFEPAKVRLYDRVFFPLVHALEARVVRPPFGQSLLAVARAKA
jgi:SAM-dependent methyltransferase